MSLNSKCCFISEYSHSLDEKGRLALPSKFREELAHSEWPEEVAARAGDGCVSLYPSEHWRKLIEDVKERIQETELRSGTLRALATQFESLTLDKAGRVLLSAKQRTAAGLGREVKVLGLGFKIEIWDPARLERREPQDKAVLEEAIKTLGLKF